jgi:TolA-binding protein
MSTRSELKENILASKVEVGLSWILAHRIPVLVAMGVSIGVILIGSVFIIRKKEKSETDWTRLSQAQFLAAEKNFAAAESIFDDITKTNPGSDVALYARYQLAEMKITEKKFDEAIQILTSVVSESQNKPAHPLALSNLGYAYEEKGDFSKAADTYRQFMSQFAEHFLAARVQLRLGVSLTRSGDAEGGKKALGQLIDLYPTSPWAENARRFMDKSKTR